MELFTLNRDLFKETIIDEFHSLIWTERYYGDSEVELVVEPTPNMIRDLPPGKIIGLIGSDEPMILETRNFEDGVVKLSGISLCKWLNNRFIRTSALHQDRHWTMTDDIPGNILHNIVYYMAIGGAYLDGTIPIGIANPEKLKVPYLALGPSELSGPVVTVAIPFGPVYDALYEIATTYELGMKIVLVPGYTSGNFTLQFRNYKGTDRTSLIAGTNPVRFSPQMDSLTDIKELQSIATYKTEVWAFTPANPDELATTPGYQSRSTGPSVYAGFDLRAEMVFAEDITTDQVGGDAAVLLNILNARAKDALSNGRMVNVVDGEVVPNIQYKYGEHYSLGDLVELQGDSGAIQRVRVTEYIRSQDSSGERGYPTLTTLV